jgi:transglutaminase-like putative cysteine protease
VKIDIVHETVYRYAVPASYSVQVLRLWPRADAGQHVLHWSLEVAALSSPTPGNIVHVTRWSSRTARFAPARGWSRRSRRAARARHAGAAAAFAPATT